MDVNIKATGELKLNESHIWTDYALRKGYYVCDKSCKLHDFFPWPI